MSVDGQQVGGTLTAQAMRASGQSDTITVNGNWGPGDHTVTVDFLNDLWEGTAETDRNLHLDGASYNGAALDGVSQTLYMGGPVSFDFADDVPAAVAAKNRLRARKSRTPPGGGDGGSGSVTVGSGSDALVLNVSGHEFNGGAEYTSG